LKLLVLLIVLGVAAWWLLGRRRRPGPPPAPQRGHTGPGPETMLACAHCGVHLPRAEAYSDATGRRYCSEAHRLAGPR
jgi:uncharacterized protein